MPQRPAHTRHHADGCHIQIDDLVPALPHRAKYLGGYHIVLVHQRVQQARRAVDELSRGANGFWNEERRPFAVVAPERWLRRVEPVQILVRELLDKSSGLWHQRQAPPDERQVKGTRKIDDLCCIAKISLDVGEHPYGRESPRLIARAILA